MAEGLTGTERIRFHDGSSQGCYRRPQFLTTDLSTRMLQCPHNMAAGFARVSDPESRESREEAVNASWDPVSEVTHCPFWQNLLFKSRSLNSAHARGRGINLLLSKDRVSEDLGTYLRPLQRSMRISPHLGVAKNCNEILGSLALETQI